MVYYSLYTRFAKILNATIRLLGQNLFWNFMQGKINIHHDIVKKVGFLPSKARC